MVITVSKQAGSGEAFCGSLAKHLGYRLINKEMVAYAAALSGISESQADQFDDVNYSRVSNWMANIIDLSLFKKANAKTEFKPYDTVTSVTADSFNETVSKIFYMLAQEGNCIVVGRGGNFILKDHPNALHLRLVAPLKFRLSNVIEEQGLSEKEAEKFIRETDENKEKYIRKYYRADIAEPTAYHFTLNIGRYSAEDACTLITKLIKK